MAGRKRLRVRSAIRERSNSATAERTSRISFDMASPSGFTSKPWVNGDESARRLCCFVGAHGAAKPSYAMAPSPPWKFSSVTNGGNAAADAGDGHGVLGVIGERCDSPRIDPHGTARCDCEVLRGYQLTVAEAPPLNRGTGPRPRSAAGSASSSRSIRRGCV